MSRVTVPNPLVDRHADQRSTIDSIAFRKARLADVAWIAAWDRAEWAHPWSQSSWVDEMERHHVVVASDGSDHPVGVIDMEVVFDTAELLRVIVDPCHRGTGVGRALVRHGLDWAVAQGAREVFLEVSDRNRVARRLYDSVGFTRVGVRRDYYGPGDDASIMVFSPPQTTTPSTRSCDV
ncbi:MAG: GNAT family N-acetyltransferase [Propionibacteriaceae bacterium]|jgi:ribosomal protein S18 acetylase RimI-like enzyme|nr:GNAT family N-acetyltransferase [Propionibacteriaceae bacterium]